MASLRRYKTSFIVSSPPPGRQPKAEPFNVPKGTTNLRTYCAGCGKLDSKSKLPVHGMGKYHREFCYKDMVARWRIVKPISEREED